MAKRFTDTGKWEKPWFRKLKPRLKCFWTYVVDSCNHAGIWDVDFSLASFFIGTKIDEEEVKREFAKQYTEISDGRKWFLKDFVDFQYGSLNPSNRTHASVIEILKKEGVWKGLTRGYEAPKDKDTDKDKDKDTDTDPPRSLAFLKKVPEQELVELSEKYKISPRGVQAKATDLELYCEAKGKRYKNYRSFLENALRKDKFKLREQYPLEKKKVFEESQPLTDEDRKRHAEVMANIRSLAEGKTVKPV